MDSRSGFCRATRTFRSLRPPNPLPPGDAPVSFPSFALSRLPSPLPEHPAFVDGSTGAALSYPVLLSRVRYLAAALRGALGVAKGHVVLVLAPPSLDLPVLFLAVMSIGGIVSPVNPLSTAADVARAVGLCNPSVVFATAATAGKVHAGGKPVDVVLLDSPRFWSFLEGHEDCPPVLVRQSDVAAISLLVGDDRADQSCGADAQALHQVGDADPAGAATGTRRRRGHAPGRAHVPLVRILHAAARGPNGETTVVITAASGGAAGVAAAAARSGATRTFVAPPVVVAMAWGAVGPEELPDLVRIDCGGAPLSTMAASAFHERFPDVELSLGYGSTEGDVISKMVG